MRTSTSEQFPSAPELGAVAEIIDQVKAGELAPPDAVKAIDRALRRPIQTYQKPLG